MWLSKQCKLVGTYLEYYEPIYVRIDHLKREVGASPGVGINTGLYGILGQFINIDKLYSCFLFYCALNCYWKHNDNSMGKLNHHVMTQSVSSQEGKVTDSCTNILLLQYFTKHPFPTPVYTQHWWEHSLSQSSLSWEHCKSVCVLDA